MKNEMVFRYLTRQVALVIANVDANGQRLAEPEAVIVLNYPTSVAELMSSQLLQTLGQHDLCAAYMDQQDRGFRIAAHLLVPVPANFEVILDHGGTFATGAKVIDVCGECSFEMMHIQRFMGAYQRCHRIRLTLGRGLNAPDTIVANSRDLWHTYVDQMSPNPETGVPQLTFRAMSIARARS